MVLVSEAALAGVVVDAINALLPAGVRAYSLGDLPNALPTSYVEVSASRRFVADGARSDGSLSRRGYRILTRLVAKRIGNVDTLAERVTEALDFSTLTVSGQPTTIDFETGDAPAPDDGWYSAPHYWTCSLNIPDPK